MLCFWGWACLDYLIFCLGQLFSARHGPLTWANYLISLILSAESFSSPYKYAVLSLTPQSALLSPAISAHFTSKTLFERCLYSLSSILFFAFLLKSTPKGFSPHPSAKLLLSKSLIICTVHSLMIHSQSSFYLNYQQHLAHAISTFSLQFSLHLPCRQHTHLVVSLLHQLLLPGLRCWLLLIFLIP